MLNGRTCWRSSGSLVRHSRSRKVLRRTSFAALRASWLNIEMRLLRRGMSISEVEVVPLATDVETSDDELMVSLADGRRISVPLVWFPRLLDATVEERAEFRLIGGGEGIHWPQVDEDISVAGLLRGARSRAAVPRDRDMQGQRPPVTEYRRRERGDTWHWCSRCIMYPTENYFVRTAIPTSSLCNECTVKSKAAQC